MVKVVKFAQEVCPKCEIMSNMMGAMGKEVDEVVMITDENVEDIKARHKIMATPTLIAFDEAGEELGRVSQVAFGSISDFFDAVGK